MTTECAVPSMGLGEWLRLGLVFALAMYATWLCWLGERGPDAPA